MLKLSFKIASLFEDKIQ